MDGIHRDHFARRGSYDYGLGCPYYTPYNPETLPYTCAY
jgi:hypothetical protein